MRAFLSILLMGWLWLPFAARAQSPTIAAAEYIIDADPGVGKGNAFPVPNSPNPSVQTQVSLQGLTPGFHSIGARFQDSQGNWSLSKSRVFLIETPPVQEEENTLVAFEYFLNADPGLGKGVKVNISVGAQASLAIPISLSGLPEGFHYISVRFQDQKGVWSIARSRVFIVENVTTNPPLLPIVAAEYFIDQDPGVGSGKPLPVTSGPNPQVIGNIPTGSLEPGFHTFSFRFRSQGNQWSLAKSRVFFVGDENFDKPTLVDYVEYFFDENDPGQGKATSIPLDQSASAISVESLIAVANLSQGTHSITVRIRDTQGIWSPVVSKEFIVGNPQFTIPPIPDLAELPTIESTCLINVADLTAPTATAEDGSKVTGTVNEALFPITKQGNSEIIWTFTDITGLKSTQKQLVNLLDNVPPVINIPGRIVLNATAEQCVFTNVDFGGVTATDNCGEPTLTNNAPQNFGFGITVVTWTAIDAVGNQVQETQEIEVVDPVAPTITAPTDVVFEIPAGSNGIPSANLPLGFPIIVENCGLQYYNTNSPEIFPVGVTEVEWQVIDLAGNVAKAIQKVTITTEELPTIFAPAPVSFNTDAGTCEATVGDLGTPFVTGENIPEDGVTNDAPEKLPVGKNVVIWTVKDGNGNTATAEQQVTVIDAELPTITAPAAVSVLANFARCDASNVALGAPTVADNCGIKTISNNAPELFPFGNTTVIWRVEDLNGNVATATQIVTVNEDQLPLISAPKDILVRIAADANSATGVALGQAEASDNCGVEKIENDAPAVFPLGLTIVTWKVTDRGGNTASATQKVTVTREAVPTITAPAAIKVDTDAGSCFAILADLGTPNVTGDDLPENSVSNDAPSSFPVGVTIVKWTLTDGKGNTYSDTQSVTISDNEKPTIVAPVNVSANTGQNDCVGEGVLLGEPTVSDNCGIASVTNDAPETYPLGTTTVTWTVTDNNGNVSTATQTVTVVDEQDPLVTAPDDVTVQIAPDADSATGVALGEAQASDNCGVASVTNNAPTTFPIGTTVVTWTVTDNSGNTATATQNVTVTREVLPTITAPAAINADTDAGNCFATLADLGTPSVTGEDIPADGISNDAPETFPVGTTVVTWTVRDGKGNTASATQQVTVTDRELPAITAPAALNISTRENGCDGVDVAIGQATVSDNCGVASVTNNAPETYPLGTTTVTWTVTDNNGNVSTATQTVTVVDEQVPLVTAPDDVTIQIAPDADSATGLSLGEAQVSDNCGVPSVTNNAPTTFPIGTTVVTWTATDNSGNTATATQNVTVTREVFPTITAPAAIDVDTDPGNCFATVFDLGAPSVTGEDIPEDGISNNAPDTFPIGTTAVTWTVRDGNGNTATATQQVSVTDREAPFILGLSDLFISADQGGCFAADVSLGEFEAGDNCSDVQVSNDAPAVFSVGVHIVTWTVTDAAGNKGGTIQRVTVQDREDPLVTAPADVTIQIDPNEDSATGVSLGEAQASDNCGMEKIENDAPNVFPLGLTVVTWTATDKSGNTATAQQRVNVTREELPTINAPADITTDAGEGDCFVEGLELGSPTFTGAGASVSNDAPDQFAVGVTPVTWTVLDANGNTATAVQQVTVADRQAPQITAPGNIAVSESERGDAPAIDLGNAVATDNCGIASIVNDAPAVFPVGMTVVTWAATDVNGNVSTALQVVTVDAATPVCTIQIKTKPEIIVVLDEDGKGRLTTAMVDDGSAYNCAPLMLRLDRTEFGCGDIGEQRVLFTVMAIDAMGTNSSVDVTIRVVDRTKPKVTVPQQPYVKVIRRGDTFVMPDLRNRVTASDNCGFELHQCPEPGKVFRTAQNGWIEFEAKDPSGNVGKGKMKFKLLVVGCRKPAKNGREELDGSEDLVTVPWNTPLPKIASDYVHFDEGSDMELARQIKWSIRDFDPMKPGFYQMEGSLPAEYLEEGDNGPAISLPVLVLNKPLPVDILAAKDRVSHKVRAGEILTGLHTVDPADDIHRYSMEPHPDVYLENNVLVWKGNHMPEARTIVTVHSTDRAGQTISRQITLYRETDRPTDLIIYPNPAMQETNLVVQIPEGANVSIRIFDAAGRLVYQEEGQHELSFTRKVDLRHFAQGMYQVIVQVDRETLQGRIIKQ